MEKTKPANISTEVANMDSSRESEVHTVSPVSPLFEETSEPSAPSQSVPPVEAEVPPPKPPRPISPRTQVQLTLSEAFPTVEASVIKAVLVASRGQIEPAFEALLAMTDPSYVPEDAPIPQSRSPAPAPTRQPVSHPDSRYPPQKTWDSARDTVARNQAFETSTSRRQLEADEMYARQLAEHYSGTGGVRTGTQAPPQSQHQQQHSEDDDMASDKEHSFLDDDLPIIKENIRQGFLQTQEKVNKWVSDLKKRLDGDPPSPENSPPLPARYAASGSGNNARDPSRRSRESVYDADPRLISDDFTHLQLRDNTGEEASTRPHRPVANPNLFQPSSISSKTSGPRKVTFQEVDDEALYRRDPPNKPASSVVSASSKTVTPPPVASKWEPLKVVEPTPLDGDPFSLGDSEDERERDDATGPQNSSVKSKSESK